MSKPRHRLVDLPFIQEGLTREAEEHAAEAVEAEDPWWAEIAPTVPDAVLWWVTEPVARLAHAYAPDLPEWDLAAVRPALCGILLWEGSCGHEWAVQDDAGRIVRGPIIGAWWGTSGGEPHVIPLARSGDLTHRVAGKIAGFGPLFHPVGDPLDYRTPFMRMLGATLILAQTETVATRHTRAPGIPHPRRPSTPARITQVVLRETVRAAHATTEAAEEAGGRKWALRNRHLVRGHWRQQACGPNHELRKPVFVPPYVKGPADAPLVTTAQVHTWRR